MPRGYWPTKVILANVIALGFQLADGQNFGWLYETAEMINNK
jgi:hypothetical protein